MRITWLPVKLKMAASSVYYCILNFPKKKMYLHIVLVTVEVQIEPHQILGFVVLVVTYLRLLGKIAK